MENTIILLTIIPFEGLEKGLDKKRHLILDLYTEFTNQLIEDNIINENIIILKTDG